MQNVLKKIIWVCLGLVPFLALYVADGKAFDFLAWGVTNFHLPSFGTSGMYFPFISGKNLLFRALVEIAFAAWVILSVRDKQYRFDWKKSPLFIAYSIFMVVLFVADLFGVDRYKSFWSNFERMEGFVGHVHFYLYFVVLHGMVRTLGNWRTLWKVHIAGNVLVVVWGFGQLFGAQGYFFADKFPSIAAKFSQWFPIHMSLNRLDATIGNSAYFAIYTLLFAFISALLWSQTKSTAGKIFYPVLIVLNLILLFYSGTRGTMIGMVVGVIIALSLVAWKEKGTARVLLASGLAALIVATSLLFALKNTDFVQASPTLARIASISPGDLTTMSRLSVWKISYQAWLEHPVLGYGQDNFSYIYARKFIPAQMWNLESWYDRSHNVFFDWLVAAGALGLLSYLSLFAAALYLMWKKGGDMPHREKALITGALAGYFVHNIFVFDNLTSYILFFTLLAYIAARTQTGVKEEIQHATSGEMSLVEPFVFLGLLIALYFFICEPYRVNTLVVKAMDVDRYTQTMSFVDVMKQQQVAFTEAVNANTLGSGEAEEQFMQVVPSMIRVTLPSTLSANDKQIVLQAESEFVQSARDHITSVYDARKDDVRALSIFGSFYNAIGDYVSAEKTLLQAHALAPHKQLISFDLIRSYLSEGKYADGYALAESTYQDAPAYDAAVKWYVIAAAFNHTYPAARDAIIADGKVIPVDVDILGAFVSTGQSSVAIGLLNELKRANPQYTAQVDAYIKQILALPVKK